MWQFLNLKPEIAGVDISDSSVKILKLKKKRGFYQIDFINKEELSPGIVEQGVIKKEDELVKTIKKALGSKNQEKLKTKYVAISLPEEKSFLEVIKMPLMEEKELKKAILFQAENYVPLPLDQVYLDFQIVSREKGHQNHLDVLIVAMPKTIVEAYSSCVKKAGLIPVVMEVESQSIARSLVKNGESQQPLIMVNFGKKNSNIIIFSEKSMRFTSSIPVSSDQITEEIAKALNVSSNEAEKIKIGFSFSQKNNDKQAEKVYGAALSVAKELANQIKKYLSFYREHVAKEHSLDNESSTHYVAVKGQEAPVEKIVLTGGGSNITGLVDFLAKETGINAEVGDVFSNVLFAEKEKNKITIEKNKYNSFCTSIGLALREIITKI